MSYRTKIFLAVLAIVIPPVLALSAFSIYSLMDVGTQMLNRQRDAFAARYNDRLRAWQSDFALQSRLELEKVELALQWQAAEVGRLPPFFSGSARRQAEADPGPEWESLHRLGQTFEPALICQFLTAGGKILWIQPYGGPRDDSVCAAPMAEAVAANADSQLPRFWTAESPGGRGAWIVFARPVYGPGGKVAGSTGMVFSADRLFSLLAFPNTVPSGSQAVLAAQADADDALTAEWPILLQATLEGAEKKPSTRFSSGGSLKADPKVLEVLKRSIETGQGGILRMAGEASESVWIYEPLKGGMFSLLIVPYKETLLPLATSASFVQERIQMQGIALAALVLGLAAALFFVSLLFSRRISSQAKRLTDGIVRLAQGDFEARVQMADRDELGKVGAAFNTLAARLSDYTACQTALSLAREIQQNLLPHSSPELEGIEVAGSTEYCDQTGGDYYDYLTGSPQDRNQLGVVVGDVAGHGVSTALIMASVRALLHLQMQKPSSFAAPLANINRQLFQDARDSGMFMTLFCAWIDAGRQTIRWVRAGHEPALTYDPGTRSFGVLNGRGVALGVLEDYDFTENTAALVPGQILLFMTDGLWEARNSSGVPFGKKRLRELIRLNASAPAREMRDAILSAVEEFCRPSKPEDDITLVVVKLAA